MHRALVGHFLSIACFAALCASATSWVLSYQLADEDTGEAIRLARACIEVGQCEGMGTQASALGLHHGTSWVRLVTLHLRNGADLRAIQATAVGLLIVSAAVSFIVLRRYLSAAAARMALLLYLQPALVVGRFAVLSNATLLPVTLACYYAALAVLVESGGTLAAVFGAVFLAAAISANLSNVLMVPFHIGVVALLSCRPVVAIPLAGLSIALAFAIESQDSARDIGALILQEHLVLGALVTCALLVSVRPLRRYFGNTLQRLWRHVEHLRQHLRSLPTRTRLRVVMGVLIPYFCLLAWTACALFRSSIPQSHYLGPMLFPWLFLTVDSITQFSKRVAIALSTLAFLALILLPWAPLGPWVGAFLVQAISGLVLLAIPFAAIRARALAPTAAPMLSPSRAAALALVAFVTATSVPDTLLFPRDRQSWSVGASEKLARTLYESALTFPQLMGSLQSQSFSTIQFMMATLDPDLFEPLQPAIHTTTSLLALQVPPEVVASTQGIMTTFPINRSRSAIVVRAPSYLDRTRLRACYSQACGASPDNCTDRLPDRPLNRRPPYFQVNNVGNPVPAAIGTYCCIQFSLPIHTSGSRTPHILRVAQQWPLQARITAVSGGVGFEGSLPGAEITLIDNDAASGTLQLEVEGYGLGSDSGSLEEAPLIEVIAANTHLLEGFRSQRTTSW